MPRLQPAMSSSVLFVPPVSARPPASAPPVGRVYQVWLIEPGAPRPVSAGVIDAASGGRGMLLVPPPAGVGSSPVVVAVTDEPRGGVPAPTGSKHLAGSS